MKKRTIFLWSEDRDSATTRTERKKEEWKGDEEERKKEIDSERVMVLHSGQPKVNCLKKKKKQHVKIQYPVILLRIYFKEVIRCAVFTI